MLPTQSTSTQEKEGEETAEPTFTVSYTTILQEQEGKWVNPSEGSSVGRSISKWRTWVRSRDGNDQASKAEQRPHHYTLSCRSESSNNCLIHFYKRGYNDEVFTLPCWPDRCYLGFVPTSSTRISTFPRRRSRRDRPTYPLASKGWWL